MKYNLTYLDYGYNSYLHSNGEQSGGKDSGSGKSANTTTNVGVGTGETQTTNVGGGTGILTNDQIGLINANAQANLKFLFLIQEQGQLELQPVLHFWEVLQ